MTDYEPLRRQYEAIAEMHGLKPLTRARTDQLIAGKVTPAEFLSRVLMLEAVEKDDEVRRRVAYAIFPKPTLWQRFRRWIKRPSSPTPPRG